MAVALAPVGLVVGIAMGFMSDDGGGGIGQEIGGVLLALLALAFPTAAVYLAVTAVRDGHPSGRAAVGVSGLELVVILVGLPILVIALGTFFIALALYLAAIAAGAVYARVRAAHRRRAHPASPAGR
jgi:hypothetical protein